jgi:predicted PurR-regulated permease PerM
MALAVAEGMPLGIDLRTLRMVWSVLVVAAAVALLYTLRHLLVLLTLSIFFAYLLYPLVWRIERHLPTRHRRTLALLLTYGLLTVAIVGAAMSLGPRLVVEVRGLMNRLPAMAADVQSGALLQGVLTRFGVPQDTIAAVEETLRAHAGEWLGAARHFATAVLGWLAGAWTVVLVPIFAFILLANGELVSAAGNFFAERRHRQLWRRVACDLHAALGHYVRALMLLSLATFAAWSLVLGIARVPYALVLAAVAALLEFVPLVGPLMAGVIAVLVSMMTGYAHPILIAGFVIAWRLVQDYVTSPLVMGHGIDVPPGLVIFAILAGGEIAGPVGMFLAVPVVAAVTIIWRDSRESAQAAEAVSPAVRRVS